jgi:hypothetical protein
MFFTDFNICKTKSIGITNLLSNITMRPGSHKGGWARLLKCQLKHIGHARVEVLTNKDRLSDFDVIVFDLGAEYSGALNLFGGLDEKVTNRLSEISQFKGEMFSWRSELPDVSVLEQRRKNTSTCNTFKSTPETFLPDVQNALKNVRVFRHAYRTDALLIGDSHTPSVWTPEFGMIERRDGRTLKGMIDHDTIKKYYNELSQFGEIKKIQVHCSSIDNRHHAHRDKNPDYYMAELATSLIRQLVDLPGVEFVISHSMGIEDESRGLPKTGYFKGTPFAGSWEARDRTRQIFNAIIDEASTIDERGSSMALPTSFFDDFGKLKFSVMEQPQSIHLSPEYYKWDLDHNRLRW